MKKVATAIVIVFVIASLFGVGSAVQPENPGSPDNANNQFSGLWDAIEALEAVVNGQIGDLQANETAQDTAIAALQVNDTAQDAAIADLQVNDTAQDTAIADLQANDTALESVIANLEANATEQQEAMDALGSVGSLHFGEVQIIPLSVPSVWQSYDGSGTGYTQVGYFATTNETIPRTDGLLIVTAHPGPTDYSCTDNVRTIILVSQRMEEGAGFTDVATESTYGQMGMTTTSLTVPILKDKEFYVKIEFRSDAVEGWQAGATMTWVPLTF